jgi:hypothetical protein
MRYCTYCSSKEEETSSDDGDMEDKLDNHNYRKGIHIGCGGKAREGKT